MLPRLAPCNVLLQFQLEFIKVKKDLQMYRFITCKKENAQLKHSKKGSCLCYD